MRRHKMMVLPVVRLMVLLACSGPIRANPAPAPLGLFEDHTDVGSVLHPGSVAYDASKQDYTVTGSGSNMWFAEDAFQFVWKKVSGDVTLTANISFANSGGNPHKKAVLIVRQSLDPDSTYADVALHGNGLTSLQYRDEKGTNTREIQSSVSGRRRLRTQVQRDERPDDDRERRDDRRCPEPPADVAHGAPPDQSRADLQCAHS